ncbi:MAG: hypothetical protein ABIA12_00135 [Candidatus Aenigmatarchaeota archaeon]
MAAGKQPLNELSEMAKFIYTVLSENPTEFPGRSYGPDKIVEIIEKLYKEEPIEIPRSGMYRIKLKDPSGGPGSEIGYIENGRLHIGGWRSPMRGELYGIGRNTYFKKEGDEIVSRRLERRLDSYVSRMQAIIKPHEDRVEIFNVGLNTIEVENASGNKLKKGGDINNETFIVALMILAFSLPAIMLAYAKPADISVTMMVTVTQDIGFPLLSVVTIAALAFLLKNDLAASFSRMPARKPVSRKSKSKRKPGRKKAKRRK